MINKIEISRSDVRPRQIIGWIVLGFCLLLLLFIFFNFSWSGAIIALIIIIANYFLYYNNKNIWNIWYEDGYLNFQNLYSSKKREISMFEKIEMTSALRAKYTLSLINGEKFNFGINKADDFKLLFLKMDSQSYAKELTKLLYDLKSDFNKE
jgi:hypothetical protein